MSMPRKIALCKPRGRDNFISLRFIDRLEKSKTPSVTSTRGVSLSSYENDYLCIKIGSQDYLRSLPVLRLLCRFPTMERETVDPTGFEPAPLSWTGLRATNTSGLIQSAE